jgi:lipopolysaccharide transport protein LptA
MASDREGRRKGGGAIRTIASSGERLRAFRSARRHSLLVRLLKLSLPLGALAAVAVYGGLLALNARLPKDSRLDLGTPRIDTSRLVMETPRYNGVGSDGTRYQVRAREAVTDLKMSGPVRLNAIEADIVQLSGVVTRLKAVWGTYDQKAEILELYERIDIEGSDGLRARLTRATVFVKESRVVSGEPVEAETEAATIRARSMVLLSKARKATFKDDVVVRLKSNAPASPAEPHTAREARRKAAAPVPGLAANSGLPIDVTAEQLDIDDTAKTALFRRRIVARQGDATLTGNELDVHYEGRAAVDQAGAQPKLAALTGTSGEQAQLKRLMARGQVVMTSKDDRAASEAMDYDAATERVVLTGDVVMTSGPERRAMARRAELDQKADTALLTGDVVVLQARNVMKGQRLLVDRRAGTTRLESPAEGSGAPGRISTLFYQSEPRPGGRTPARAEPPPSPFGAQFKTDPNAPIEIEAETLDVADARKTAVFKGNVIARQADFVVRTSEMTAHYTGQAAALAPGGAAATAKSPQAGRGAQLSKAEARQKVIVTSKDGQQAVGDWADFNVGESTVVIGGNVVVSQGENKAVGSRFVIDLTTGVSRFEQPGAAAPAGAPGTPAGAGPRGPAVSAAETGTNPACPPGIVCKSDRPAAIFYPGKMQEEAKRKAAEAAAQKGLDPGKAQKLVKQRPQRTEASSWEATTQTPPDKKK